MKIKALSLWLICILLAGCASNRLAAMKPEIEVEIVNQSLQDLENAQAHFGEYVCSWGWLIKGATKGYGFYPHPITPRAELHWDVEGKHHVKTVDLSKIYPPGKSGRLTFTVRDDGVAAKFTEKIPEN